MSSDHKNHSESQANEEEVKTTNLSRRKFAKAGLIAAPVVMTLTGRPAMGAYQCTVSGMLSGNLSNHVDDVICSSKSEGVWKGTKALGKADNDGTYPNHWWPFPYTPETPFHNYFSTLIYNYGSATMLQVMNASSNPNTGGLGISDDSNVGFAVMGSLLNAAYYGKESYGYSHGEIIAHWNGGGSFSLQDLHDYYSMLNHRWDSDSIPPWG